MISQDLAIVVPVSKLGANASVACIVAHRGLAVAAKRDAIMSLKTFKWLVLVIAMTTAWPAAAQGLTQAEARAVIAPWYRLFNLPVEGDMATLQQEILTADYESCWGYLPGECWGRDTSIKVVEGFSSSIPDMKFEIEEVLVSGDRVIVRGQVSGTPAGDLFGVPHTGKSFKIKARPAACTIRWPSPMRPLMV